MSAQSVETILSRAMSDSAFADSLFASPAQALAGFELTAEEVENFKGLSRAEFEEFSAATPEERKSLSILSAGSKQEADSYKVSIANIKG